MGKECCYSASQLAGVPPGARLWYMAAENKPPSVAAGFVSVTATAQQMTVSYHDQAGNTLYTAEPAAPRRAVNAP